MAEERVLSGDEQLRLGREQFESATDFTVAVEEEFAILDPETLSLTDGFEQLKAAAQGTELEPHLVGELIASEVEVRTGRCETFADAVALVPKRRAQLRELADGLGFTLGATGAHPWSPWQEQRIIDTPHYRVRDELLRYVVWRNNTFGIHVHVAIHGPDRAVQVCDAFRTYLPELLALSASSPFLEHVNTGLHSVRTQIFTRFFPRCGIPDVYGDWRTFEDYVPLPVRHGLHPRAHGDVVVGAPAPRLPDGRDPDLRRAAAPGGGDLAGGARVLADGADRPRARRGRGAAPPATPRDRGELLARDPLGAVGRDDRPATHEVRPTRAALEELIEWVQPVAEELGAAEYLSVPSANAAERQIARFEEGATLEEIYAEQVRPKEVVGG